MKKWKDAILVLLIAVCCWLVFDKLENGDDYDSLQGEYDELERSDKMHQAETRMYKLKFQKNDSLLSKKEIVYIKLKADADEENDKFFAGIARDDTTEFGIILKRFSDYLEQETGSPVRTGRD